MNTTSAEQFAAEFAKSMERAGYQPSDAFEEALRNEFATIASVDNEMNEEDGTDEYDSLPDFLDALAYAANRVATYRN